MIFEPNKDIRCSFARSLLDARKKRVLGRFVMISVMIAIYDSNGHAGVKIKYISLKNKITIFVFESGSIIIILGNQGFTKIQEVYDFIYKYLLENYEAIVKNDDYAKVIIQKYIDKELSIKS